MSIGKVVMPCREYRAFSLNHSLHTSLFQVLADSVWVRMFLDTKSRDGRNIETSGRCQSTVNSGARIPTPEFWKPGDHDSTPPLCRTA
ncbi:hypothetical protein PAXRUDRAFT_148045 [Paxillus rubicundulus Ve08.2h10]|uniref:Uncharacterized protein n=1 Tax=Paxillus rubicundulus Ve08.2h10 TaxID=930991 RepID=A0A0D0DTS4_9AGAM|nr:hypothetical protein PAXRUDRAFT_148045 [Paxillus rubicundulus Ve08.2h10]